MKQVLITQRVDIIAGRNERRDALDQRWHGFLHELGITAIPVPNNPDWVKSFSGDCAGIILSGGNDLAAYGGDAPERDETEKLLIDYAIKNNVPLLGVCRGMQMLQHYFGGKIEKVKFHAGTRHTVTIDGELIDVNSFHDFGIVVPANEMKTTAIAFDETVEGFKHNKHNISGIMWHPEREENRAAHDIKLFKEIFGLK